MTKKNRVQDVHIATGGHVLAQNADRHKAAVVRVPPHKTTGNLPPEQPTGFAKASPTFKDVPRKDETDPEKQKKTLAENTLEAKDKKQDDKK